MALETFPKPARTLEHWSRSLSLPTDISDNLVTTRTLPPPEKCMCANVIRPACQGFTDALRPTEG